MSPLINALTIDVEDYFHVTAFEGSVQRRQWDDFPSRVVPNTHRVLHLLDRLQIRATFFVLGWVGHRYPGLVRDIAAAGHEIGCHSYWHRLIFQLTPEEFRQDLLWGRDVLQQVLGDPVDAYRAPSYSITRQSLWALEILGAEGFRFDSSIFPIYHDRYGIPDAQPFLHRVQVPGELWEFPASVYRICGWNIPVAGGGYFRLYPERWTAYCLGEINRKLKQPFVFYIHPWELDPDQPRLSGSLLSRGRHYLNLSSTARKLAWLLPRFHLGSLSDVWRRMFCAEDPRQTVAFSSASISA